MARTKDVLNGVTVFGHPDYVAASGRLAELKTQQQKITDEINDHQGRRERLSADIDKQAEAVLEGGTATTALAEEIKTASEVVDKLTRDLRVINRSIQIGEQRLKELQVRLSREACDKLRERHAALVKHTALALQELVGRNRELMEFDGAVEHAGIIRCELPILHAHIVTQGNIVPNGIDPWFLAEARRLGFLDRKE